jgi:hypothetical protein
MSVSFTVLIFISQLERSALLLIILFMNLSKCMSSQSKFNVLGRVRCIKFPGEQQVLSYLSIMLVNAEKHEYLIRCSKRNDYQTQVL